MIKLVEIFDFFDRYTFIYEYLKVLIWPLFSAVIIFIFYRQIIGLLEALKGRIKYLKKASPRELEFYQPSAEDKEKRDLVEIRLYHDLLNNAKKAIENSNHLTAIAYLKKANIIFPNQWNILHNLAVELIRYGKPNNKFEYLVEAENVCRSALYITEIFPYGTLYNLARAQAANRNVTGLKETFHWMAQVEMPGNLSKALADGDPDFENYKDVIILDEYINLKAKCVKKHAK